MPDHLHKGRCGQSHRQQERLQWETRGGRKEHSTKERKNSTTPDLKSKSSEWCLTGVAATDLKRKTRREGPQAGVFRKHGGGASYEKGSREAGDGGMWATARCGGRRDAGDGGMQAREGLPGSGGRRMRAMRRAPGKWGTAGCGRRRPAAVPAGSLAREVCAERNTGLV